MEIATMWNENSLSSALPLITTCLVEFVNVGHYQNMFMQKFSTFGRGRNGRSR